MNRKEPVTALEWRREARRLQIAFERDIRENTRKYIGRKAVKKAVGIRNLRRLLYVTSAAVRLTMRQLYAEQP